MPETTPSGFIRITENDQQILVNAAQIAFIRQMDGYTSVYLAGAKDQLVNVREPLGVIALLIERSLGTSSATADTR